MALVAANEKPPGYKSPHDYLEWQAIQLAIYVGNCVEEAPCILEIQSIKFSKFNRHF